MTVPRNAAPIAALCFALLASAPLRAASPDVVISEIFNRGTAGVDVTGWSVQYAAAGGTTWQRTNLPSTTLAPGQYLLVQESQGTGGTQPLPTPDAIGNI